MDEGSSAVEFALVLPVLVLLVFGIIEFGRAFNAYVTVTHAAREGARMAAVGRFDAAAVQDRAYPLTGVGVSVSGPSGGTDGYYTVTVTYPYHLAIPLWGDRNLTLTSVAKMRRE